MKDVVNGEAADRRIAVSSDHYIVAIGASAGGLEAIHEFFDNMPANSNLSFVLIQHLSPDYKSLLVELVSKHTHMKVFEAGDKMTVQKECIYVIPNKKLMTIHHGKLHLVEKVQEKAPNTAIDHFLYTLAREKGDKAIALILSGTGTDGTRGIEAVKNAGGIVMVQDPITAKFDGMPNSAITSGNADFILPPEMMPEEIYQHIKETPVHILNRGKIDDRLLNEIFSLIYDGHGYDFHYYKTPTIIRRIAKRMGQQGVSKLPDYVELLKSNPDELKRLSKDFLIGVTRFFRDQPAFDSLYKDVLPSIINEKEDGDFLKIWVCACSTGEEAYSIAILIDQYLEQYRRHLDVKIFATDIDESNIEFAARNLYPLSIEKDIDKEILKKYFVGEEKGYSIIPRIRKQIVFARHNVIKDPPFIKNDLVSCRNMLIYMNTVLQQKVVSTLHFSLMLGGYLFLGSSETAAAVREGVDEINSKWKIYRKIGKNHASGPDFYRQLDNKGREERKSSFLTTREIKKGNYLADDFASSIIEDFGYVCFYIDNNYEIREAAGNFNRFLSLPEKKLNLNILKMVPQELSVALNTAVRKCWKDGNKVFLKSVRVKQAENDVFLSISVRPPQPLENRPHTLIVLGENSLAQILGKDEMPAVNPDENSSDYIGELEAELTETRSNLQLAIEGLETTNEELQSSNEELLSSNEELQSSNEELQSLNEELHTLNTEHQLKIRELIELNDDFNNYFRSTDIGQIFLDSDLRIRKFNTAAVRLVNLIDSDIGRPISHISTNIRYAHLLKDIQHVISTDDVVEKEIILNNDNRCLMRILPFLRQDKKADGVIVTFIDISAITNLNNIINGIFNSSLSAIMAFKAVRDVNHQIEDFVLLTGNYASEAFFGTEEKSLESRRLKDLAKIAGNGIFEKYVHVAEQNKPLHTEIFLEDDGRWLEVVAVKMMDGFVATFTDISEKRIGEQKLRTNFNELITTRENLKRLNMQLEDKVMERTRELAESDERFRTVAKATNDAIWDWNFVDNTLWWSDSFYSIFGYEDVEEASTVAFWLDNIHPDDREAVHDSIFSVINAGQNQWAEEYRFRRSDGNYAYILDRAYVLHDEYGTPHRMLGSMLDITEVKSANLEIKKKEGRFYFLADAIPQKVWTALPDGSGDYFNKGWMDYTGKSYEELSGWQWMEVIHPDDREKNKRLWLEAVKTGADFEMERRLLRADGKYRWHLSRAIPQKDEHGAITMWVGTSTDIQDQIAVSEALKISEDYFRQLADQSPFMIWKVDNKGLCNYVNKQWIGFTGFSYDDSMGLGWGQTFHPDDSEREYKKFMDAFERRVSYHSKFRLRSVNGEYHWVLAQANPLAGPSFDGYIGSLTDITEQELAQQAMKLLMHKKDEFMSIASHELKTPITSMKASLQIAERLSSNNGDAVKIRSFIEKANKHVNKLTALVEDLLDVTKIQAGKLQLEKTTVNLSETIQDCLEQVQSGTLKHQIFIEGEEDVLIEADRHRLEQVIINFLSNAIKYSPDADKVMLKVEHEAGGAKVSVTDYGIGIPQDKINFVFDRFFRVQESSQKFSGLGLGLFISAEIINRHNGKVGVSSEEGKGSTFWFSLPV